MIHDDIDDTMRGGRWWRAGDGRLALRLNERSGFLSYLSRPLDIRINDLQPGVSLTLTEPRYVGDTIQPVTTTFQFAAPGHIYGPPTQLNLRGLVGRYLVVRASGEREVWDFAATGDLYVNRATEFVHHDYAVIDGKLRIETIFQTLDWPLSGFERGRGFAVHLSSGGANVFYYMDGPHWAERADLPMPTPAERERALAQEFAITQKSHATAAALNASMAQMSQMMDMIADDIADRPYRYEWRPQ